MRDLDGRQLHSRVKGRQALERSIRGLLIRVHRFGRGRATSARDVLWCSRAIDTLTDLLPWQNEHPDTDEGRRV